ncbi:apses-domain-containing protein [Serendipita vermifera]|nr:apses-domain-containing protein [Serendipita vermifera]
MNMGPQPRVYPAVYSGVGVYECMIRGIAVMRRRADSYVNATQILKVAGIDKGRRTKILEKEILPGKHEIVQGGYGKYQGTWIPLERGRDVAAQYGVAALLAPLFDHVPNPAMMGAMPPQMGTNIRGSGPVTPMPFPPHMRPPPPYMIHYMPPNMMHGRAPMFHPGAPLYSPYPIPTGPGGQPRMPPMYAPQHLPPGPQSTPGRSITTPQTLPPGSTIQNEVSDISPSAPSNGTTISHKRSRNEIEAEPPLSQGTDITMVNGEDDTFPLPNGVSEQPPFKRARTDVGPPNGMAMDIDPLEVSILIQPTDTIDPKALSTIIPLTPLPLITLAPGLIHDDLEPRLSNVPVSNRIYIHDAIQKSTRRKALYGAIQKNEPEIVLRFLLEQSDDAMLGISDINAIIDDKGHTTLHISSALGKLAIVEALIARGADVHRGNYRGETALIRAVLSSNNYRAQTFERLLNALQQSLRTKDQSHMTVLHHISQISGLSTRVMEAKYYLETILMWVGKHQNNKFDTLLDLCDENEDTALNIAARLGSKAIVNTLINFGSDIRSTNKFGMRPVDYGIIEGHTAETPIEEPGMTETQPSPVRSSEDVIDDMLNLVKTMSTEVAAEKATKRSEYESLQSQLTDTTKLLARKRRELEELRSRTTKLDQVNARIRTLDTVQRPLEVIEWTGRTHQNMDAAKDAVSPSFWKRKSHPLPSSMKASIEKGVDAAMTKPLTEGNSMESLILLRRTKLWYERVMVTLAQKNSSLSNLSTEKEQQLKKIISLCTGFSGEEIDEQVSTLLESIESELQDPGQMKLAEFMDRVCFSPTMMVDDTYITKTKLVIV